MVFMLLVEIFHVSPNGIVKQDETFHNLKTETPMEKQLVLLVLRHHITTRDAPIWQLQGLYIVYFKVFLN